MQGPDPVPPIWQEILRYWILNPTWSLNMNIQDIFYHGIRDQVRRILNAMTDEEIDRGISAFETGSSSWSHCFFARALPQLELDAGRPEEKLVAYLKCGTVIPVRIVYCTFDGVGVSMSKTQLLDFIKSIRHGNDDALSVLKTINYEGVGDRPVNVGESCTPPIQGKMYNSLVEDEFPDFPSADAFRAEYQNMPDPYPQPND